MLNNLVDALRYYCCIGNFPLSYFYGKVLSVPGVTGPSAYLPDGGEDGKKDRKGV